MKEEIKKGEFEALYEAGHKRNEHYYYNGREEAWRVHKDRAHAFENKTDWEISQICLNGWTERENVSGWFKTPEFAGTNRYSNDSLFQALRKIGREEISQYFRNHKMKYLENSRGAPKAKLHKEMLEHTADFYKRQIKKRGMSQETYERLNAMAQKGKLLDGLFRETGEDVNIRQEVLLSLTDLRDVAYFLTTGRVDSNEANRIFGENAQLHPFDIIALYTHKGDHIAALEREPNVIDRYTAMHNLVGAGKEK
jgi:hypothetical protein